MTSVTGSILKLSPGPGPREQLLHFARLGLQHERPVVISERPWQSPRANSSPNFQETDWQAGTCHAAMLPRASRLLSRKTRSSQK